MTRSLAASPPRAARAGLTIAALIGCTASTAVAAPFVDLDRGTYFGGEGGEFDVSVAGSPGGGFVLVGSTDSKTGIATPGAFTTTPAATFVARVDATGKRLWGGYFGGPLGGVPCDVLVDAQGFVYLFGHTISPEGIATPGAYQEIKGGHSDLFLIKLTPDGSTRLWGTYYGGAHTEACGQAILDGQGRILLAARAGSDGLATPGALQPISLGYEDALLAIFSTGGELLEATYLGAPGQLTAASGIALDSQGRMIVGGTTTNIPTLTTPGAHQTVYGGGDRDSFIAVFTGHDAIVWATYYGGKGFDYLSGIGVDSLDHIFVAGSTGSADAIATPGAFRTTPQGSEGYVAKFTPGGARLWGTYYGGEDADILRGFMVDAADDVWLAGWTDSETGIATPDAFQTTWDSGLDVFIGKLDSDGQRLWGSYYAGNGFDDMAHGLAQAGPDRILMTGSTNSTDDVATPNAPQGAMHGFNDGFIVTIRTAPALACADDSDCPNAPCVDGMCCEAACGGGLPGDCQACSQAAGAWKNGVCDQLGPQVICRPGDGVCDAAEACPGDVDACPIDQDAPDGTPCDGGVCGDGVCGPDDTTGDDTTGASTETEATTEASTTGEPDTTTQGVTSGESSTSATTGGPATAGTTSGDPTGESTATPPTSGPEPTTGESTATPPTSGPEPTTGESTATPPTSGPEPTTGASTTGGASGSETTAEDGGAESVDPSTGCACTHREGELAWFGPAMSLLLLPRRRRRAR